jgi:hypothetical protein
MEKEKRWSCDRCPVCSVMDAAKSMKEKYSDFYTHFYNARIEMLQGIRSLIDRRISSLEKSKSEAARSGSGGGGVEFE